jgi:hypothetical protein
MLTAYLSSPLERHRVKQLVASFIHTPALWKLLRFAWVALHGCEPAHITLHNYSILHLFCWVFDQHVPTCPEHHS